MSRPEKPRADRKRTNDVVEFYDSEGTLLLGVGRLLDISETGALVESSVRLSLGHIFQARIRQSNRAQRDTLVTVVRVRGKGSVLTYGIQFKRA